MADSTTNTTFTAKVTLIKATFLNHINKLLHTIFDGSETKAEARNAIGMVGTSTNHGIPRHDGTSGALQDSGITIDDNDNIRVPGTAVMVNSGSAGSIDINSDQTSSVVSRIRLRGNDSTGAKASYAVIQGIVDTATAGSEDGSMKLFTADGGSLKSQAKINPSGVAALGFRSQDSNISISDDAATSIEFNAVAHGIVVISGNAPAGGAAVVHFRVGGSVFAATLSENIGGGGTVTTTTGTLGGTTGTDGHLTISVHTDNKLYIENRTGANRTYQVTFLSLQNGYPDSL